MMLPPSTATDQIYRQPQAMLVDFQFNEAVAAVFPDMIRRSVPSYGDMVAMVGLFAERYLQRGSRGYDLGCSLGASSIAMASRIPHRDYQIIAVDNSPAMIARCRDHLRQNHPEAPIQLICADLHEVVIADASIVVLNFTLQFIPLAQRSPLIERIYAGLRPGGILLLAEKIAYPDPEQQQWQESMQLAFKQANGYSALEISQKRAALEHTLIPETLEAHQQRLTAAGFAPVECWFHCFNFAALAAIK